MSGAAEEGTGSTTDTSTGEIAPIVPPGLAQQRRRLLTLFDVGSGLAEAAWLTISGLGALPILHAAGWALPMLASPLPWRAGLGYIALAAILRVYPRGEAAFFSRDLWPTLTLLAVLFSSIALFGLHHIGHYEAAFLLAWGLLGSGGVILLRYIAPAIGRRLLRREVLLRPAVVVGSGPGAAQLIAATSGRKRQKFTLLGYFDDRQGRGGEVAGLLPYLGRIDDLIEFIEDHEDLDVFIALPWTAGERIASMLERLRFLPVTVRLTPDPSMSALAVADLASAESVRMPTLMTPPFSRLGQVLKFSFDFIGGTLLILLFAPLLALFALLIKLDSPGPVFFRQSRSGQFGRKFDIIKFRSLHVATADAEAVTLVSKGDSRVTRVGRFIRKYSIDELPQLFNVVRGELSLVGPRPHAPKAKADGKLYAAVVPNYAIRYRAKPGMTGWAQVNGWRGETDTEEKLRKRVEFDFYYIEHWSFGLDMMILLRTVPAVLFPPKTNV